SILKLERALRLPAAGIVISGLGGIGKTALVRGFLHWLQQTGGIWKSLIRFDFSGIRSAEYVFDRLGQSIFGTHYAALTISEKLAALSGELRNQRCLLIWDNFESAR